MTSHPASAWEERAIREGAAPWRRAVLGVLAPFIAPTKSPVSDATARVWWRLVCALSVLPVTALLHWGLFHRPTCILNNFGHEYTPAVVWLWLSRDPSLPWAIIAMFAVYRIGLSRVLMRGLVAPGFAAGFLFTLWIWDIPFSGRVVCGHLHDNAVMLAEGVPLRTVHVLGVCSLLYVTSMCWVLPRFVGAGSRRTARGASRPEVPATAPAGIPVYATAAYPRARFNPDMER